MDPSRGGRDFQGYSGDVYHQSTAGAPPKASPDPMHDTAAWLKQKAAQAAEAIGLTDETSALEQPPGARGHGLDKDELVEESRRVLQDAREGLSHAFGGGTDKRYEVPGTKKHDNLGDWVRDKAMDTKEAILGNPDVEAEHAAKYHHHSGGGTGAPPAVGVSGTPSLQEARPSRETELKQRTLI